MKPRPPTHLIHSVHSLIFPHQKRKLIFGARTSTFQSAAFDATNESESDGSDEIRGDIQCSDESGESHKTTILDESDESEVARVTRMTRVITVTRGTRLRTVLNMSRKTTC